MTKKTRREKPGAKSPPRKVSRGKRVAAPPIAVIDMGASAVRLVVAETPQGEPAKILEEVSRGVLLGRDTFTNGRLDAATIEATLKALTGFKKIMDTYGVVRYRAVATSAVREAQNRETFLDRVRLRTGLAVEIINGAEENRLTYMAVREALRGHRAMETGEALLVEIGGGSADISLLRNGEPAYSGTYPLGSIRMRQSLASWHGSHEQRIRLLKRHIHNVVGDIEREMPLNEARHFLALGGDMRFASQHLGPEDQDGEVPEFSRTAFLSFCDEITSEDPELAIDRHRLPVAEAETLVPALLAYRELLSETRADRIVVPDATLRAGLILDLARTEGGHGIEDFSKQVLTSARALGEKYRYDAAHASQVEHLATRLFDQLQTEHGLAPRDRLLLRVAALLHDIGIYVSLRAHHKHSQYLLAVTEIFGLTRDDMAVVSNVARYHRRATPQRSHIPYMALDPETRVTVNKLAAILRLANALDADHAQKVDDVRVASDENQFVLALSGAEDLTMERLVAQARADFFVEVFGRRVSFRETVTPE